MRIFTLLLIICLAVTLHSCDDLFKMDGTTKVTGYVIDTVSGAKVPNALVYLMKCRPAGFYPSACNTFFDSIRTDNDGFYLFEFEDERKTNFGVRVPGYPKNDFYVMPLYPTLKNDLIEEYDYEVNEGKTNNLDFQIKYFSSLKVNIKTKVISKMEISIGNSVPKHYTGLYNEVRILLNNKALDTTIYLKAIPYEVNDVGVADVTYPNYSVLANKKVSIEGDPLTEVLLEF